MTEAPSRPWTLLGAAALVTAALCLVPPQASGWEWLVVASSRILGGETLYLDVFSGTTPLALVFQALAMRFLPGGPWIPIVTIQCLFAVTLVSTIFTAEMLRIPRAVSLGVLALLAIWLTPLPGSVYSWWSLAGLAVTQSLTARWIATGSPGSAIMAGMTAGVAFCAKPNVGLLAIAAVVATLILTTHTRGPAGRVMRLAGFSVSAFAAISGACLLWIASIGGWAEFLSQCFTGKTVYLAQASVPYTRYMARALVLPGTGSWPGLWLQNTVYMAPFVLPFLGLPLLDPARPRREGATMLGVFALAALGCVYPRPDLHHMIFAAPALALVIGALIASLGSRHAVLPSLAIGGIVAVGQFAASMNVEPRPDPKRQRQERALERAAPDGTLLILHSGAPAIYLATGLKNPTRYDFPLVTAFGPRGQEDVIRQIAAGRVPAVCLLTDRPSWSGLAPERLLQYIEANMEPGPDLELCRIYRPRTP